MTETTDNLPIVTQPRPRGFQGKLIPQVTVRLVTARSEHYLCNPHVVVKEVLRTARNEKTTAMLTAIINLQPVVIEVNPSYIVLIEYLPTGE